MNTLDIASAYDSIAEKYDSLLEEDRAIRLALWSHYQSCFKKGQRILDVACGTGIDTLFLAMQGIKVTSIDISPGMISELQKKLINKDLEKLVETRVLDAKDMPDLLPVRYDGIISAFAGINTIFDLDKFAANASELLNSDGCMIVHMLNRCSLWKQLKLMTQLRWTEAIDLRQQCEQTFNIGGQPVKHWLYTPLEAYNNFFRPYFELRHIYGLGIFQPPLPGTQTPLEIETWSGKFRPFFNWGRFYVLELVKRV